MEKNKLLMPFVGENDDPKYIRGFELGQMWSKMELNYKFDNYLFHSPNSEQIELMCKRFHYSCRIDKIDETWSSLFADLQPTVN
jgi:hypothetical protein